MDTTQEGRHEYAHGDRDKKRCTAHTELSPYPPVITRDGAILRSNLDDGDDESMSTPERDSRVRGRVRSGEERRHVMSFMQYDSLSGSDSPLRGSLGKEDDEAGFGLGLKGVRIDGKREKDR